MTFGGGPFNNYVLQGAAAMAGVLRAAPAGTVGLTSAMSGPFTKPGVALWSTAEPRAPFAAVDVTSVAAARTHRRAADPDLVGPATVVGATVAVARDGTPTAIVLAESHEGVRTVAQSADPAVTARYLDTDVVGSTVTLTEPGVFAAG
jgi:acetyl-CoA C-acetyltransferase